MKTRFSSFARRPATIAAAFSLNFSVFLVPVVALILAASAPELWARRPQAEPFSKTKMIIEFNSSANDIGVQVLLDGEPWQSVRVESPDGRRIMDIKTSQSLRQQGLTELFFESSEPSLDEVPLEEFLAIAQGGNQTITEGAFVTPP
jgi:hypothetical protein